MSLIEAFIFGLMQGLTEFFPISSSAHIKLAKLFFGVQSSESQVLFDLVCHLGTLFALLFFLRHQIATLFRTDRHKLFLIFIATLPLIPCYFLLKPLRDFASHPNYLGICLILTSLILFCGQKYRVRKTSVTSSKKQMQDVLWIGALQSAALIPGISRSASTLSCARVLGWEQKEAVRFSFLLSIPTIVGGNCLELLKLYLQHEIPTTLSFSACAVGLFTSFMVGLLVIRFAFPLLEKGKIKPFAWYCLCFGAGVTIYIHFIQGAI